LETFFLVPISLTEICVMVKRNTNELAMARIMFVEQGKTQKEIAKKLHRTEKTIGTWVQKYGWKNERTARLNSVKNQEIQINEILNHYANQTLKLLKELRQHQESGDDVQCLEINKKLTSISDDVSKWNKRLESLNKDHKASLSTYLFVMDDLFESMRNYDEDLYNRTIDFQEKHLSTISIKLG